MFPPLRFRVASIGLGVMLLGGHHVQAAPQATTRPKALKIVVIQGEDAVNVIQQRTATTPIVEVRDQNDQPVAGAVVRFAIRSGRATFNGARTVTLTTNAAGQATATGLNATGSGALQITASATFQGQAAVATITQTNVISLGAAGSGAGAGAGAAGGAAAGTAGGVVAGAGGAGAAGAGGGLSITTLAIVGGAAAGGAIAVNAAIAEDKLQAFEGPFSGNILTTSTSPKCTITQLNTGVIDMDVDLSNGGISGTGGFTMSTSLVSTDCPGFPTASSQGGCCSPAAPVQGTPAGFTFSGGHAGGAGTFYTFTFTGAQNGSTFEGAFTLTIESPTSFGTATYPVTLR